MAFLSLTGGILAACSSSGAGAGAGAGAGGGGGMPVTTSTQGGAGGANAGATGHGGGGAAGAPTNGGSAGSQSTLWSRTGITTCSTLGQGCSLCSSDTICYQYLANACVPRGREGLRCSVGSCTGDLPYCIDDHCMSLAEASCFCTADPGNTFAGCMVSPADQLAANGAASACSAAGSACGVTSPACCAGSTCAAVGNDPYTCLKSCTMNSDCTTGCCVAASQVCGPATACP
jgi:trimeric autotransporter adhesin